MIQRIKQSLKLIWLILSDSRYRIIFRSGLFDKEYYLHAYPDVITSNLHPLIHYLDEGGALQGRKPNLFFDPSFYLQQSPEIRREGYCHYCIILCRVGGRTGNLPLCSVRNIIWTR